MQSGNMVTIVKMRDGSRYKVPGKTIPDVNAVIVSESQGGQDYWAALRRIGATRLLGAIGEAVTDYKDKDFVGDFKGLGIHVYQVREETLKVGVLK